MKKGNKNNAYVFPNSIKVPQEHSNPYVQNLIDSLSVPFNVINANAPTSMGIIDILKNIRKINWLFLNWIENIPERKGGFIQFLLFYFLLVTNKLLRVKIVYVLHNKVSHSKKYFFFKKLIFKSILKHSSYIITHSSEGVSFASEEYGISPEKIFFIHHPIEKGKKFLEENVSKQSKVYDILIWGTMVEYKGIYEFVANLNNFKHAEKIKILIAGKFINQEYFEKVKKICGENITIQNSFLSEKILHKHMTESRIILFTYSPGSILSSGALMDSLFSPSYIIGPNNGSFTDFEELSLISTFNNFDDLESLIFKVSEQDMEKLMHSRKLFVKKNSWDHFAQSFINFVSN